MSKKKAGSKKRASGVTRLWRRLGTFVRGRGRIPAAVLLLGGVAAGVWLLTWELVEERAFSASEYWLEAEDLQITPAPAWICTDVAAEVFREASLEGPLSIMDKKLNGRMADAFAGHPWVANVLRVRKYHPARLRVELVYRRPVCMVQLGDHLWPVDVRGILLPEGDFSPLEKRDYPRLVGVDTAPIGPAGTRWGDVRVVDGAQIAEVLGEVWSELNLDRIVPTLASRSNLAEPYSYELFTRSGTKILWGRAPGTDLPGESPAVEKVARLKNYVDEYGPLQGPRAPREIDVRQGLRVSHRPQSTHQTADR